MTDQTTALPQGDETPKLQSGNDLAQAALAEVSTASSATALLAGTTAQTDDLAQTLTALQNIIERNASELDRLKEELKTQRDSLKSIFENDAELSQAAEQATLVTQEVKQQKARVKSSAVVLQLNSKINELNEQKKEVEEALNNHLLNLYQVTGAKTLDTSDGEQREFKIRASLMGSKKALKSEE